MSLTITVEILLGISAIIVAIRNIYSFIISPKKVINDYQKKQHDELISTIESVIRKEMKEIQSGVDYHERTLRLILATQIERIYWAGFKEKILYTYNQEPLYAMYETYHSLGGNGHISNLIEQMKTWRVVDNSQE